MLDKVLNSYAVGGAVQLMQRPVFCLIEPAVNLRSPVEVNMSDRILIFRIFGRRIGYVVVSQNPILILRT